MPSVLDEPSVVLVCVTIAAALLVAEVALPTLGIAGTVATAAAVAAGVGVARDDLTWWPLIGPAAAVAVWAGLIVARRASAPAELVAAACFALGGLGFAAANDDIPAALVTIAATIGLALAFPRVLAAAVRVLERPSDVGMDGLVGRTATVDRWQPGARVVYLDGTRWNAEAADGRAPVAGDRVTVIGYRGSTVQVRGAAADPGLPMSPPVAPSS